MRRSSYLLVAAVGLTIAAACEGRASRDAATSTEATADEDMRGEAVQVAPAAPEMAPAPPATSFGATGSTGGMSRAARPQDPSAAAVDRADATGAQGTG